MIEMGSSLYVAVEEANFLLHHVWIHVLKSKYHPMVKQFAYDPGAIKIEIDQEGWMPLPPRDWTANPGDMSDDELDAQAEAFEKLSEEEQVAASNKRSRRVAFVILALKTDEWARPEPYQLMFTVHLHADADNEVSAYKMKWRVVSIDDLTITNALTGNQLPPHFSMAGDCMNDRYYGAGENKSRYENAVHFYA